MNSGEAPSSADSQEKKAEEETVSISSSTTRRRWIPRTCPRCTTIRRRNGSHVARPRCQQAPPTSRNRNDCKPAPRQGYQQHGADIEEVPNKEKTACPHCKRTYNRWHNLFKHMGKDRGWENAQRLPQLFRQGAAPQGAADHPDRGREEKDSLNRPSNKMRPQGRSKLKLSLSTSTSQLNSEEGNIHTQDHHVINK